MAQDPYGNRFTCQYIPILETVKVTEVLNGHISTDETLDICHGSKVNSSPFFSGDEKLGTVVQGSACRMKWIFTYS